MSSIGEACHVGSDFGEQDLGGVWAHPGNGIQERYCLLRRDEVLINGSTDAVNRLIQVIDLAEVLGHQKVVMGGEVAPQGCRQLVPLRASRPRASSARTATSRSPARRVSNIARAEAPRISVTTERASCWHPSRPAVSG